MEERRKKIRKIEDLEVYQKALELFHDLLEIDAPILLKHLLGRELAKNQVRSLDSICANMEEGFSRKKGKEFKRFLRISHGSGRESKGRYGRMRKFLSDEITDRRIKQADTILAMLYSMMRNIPD